MTHRKRVQEDPAMLEQEIAALKLEIVAREARKTELLQQLVCKDYESTTKNHIKLLHEYNEIRDLGHMLIGKIAMEERVMQKEVMERFGVTLAD